MKKLICLIAFIGLGYMGVQAQNAVAPVAAPASAVVVSDQAVEAPKDAKAGEAKAEKKADKKDCSTAEKKNCSTSHSCCRKKAEAKEVKLNP